jgi:hypothetical protein
LGRCGSGKPARTQNEGAVENGCALGNRPSTGSKRGRWAAGCFHNARSAPWFPVDGAAEAEREPRGLADGPRSSPRQMVGRTGVPAGVSRIVWHRLRCESFTFGSGAATAGPNYQWYRSATAIGGATSGTYTLGDADVGAAITVKVTYTDGEGFAETITSAASTAVTARNDAAGTVTIRSQKRREKLSL